MTSIPALSPVTSVLPNAVEAENNPRALTTSPDFQSQLKAQSKPPLLPPSPATAQVLTESTADTSRRPDVEAMLQLLAWRKITFNAPSKIGRSVPGALASGLAVPDYSFADHTFLVGTEMIDLARADEHSTVLCPEPIEDPTAWRADSCGSDFTAGASCEGGLNAAAIAVALSASTLTWIPIEIVRAPLQSPRIQIWRRRKPRSAEGHHPDQSDADVDNNLG
ncbi:hypothetical protein [Pseudomonas sp. Q11]|uniref:hypothetical protein n=1 Tax=Pseudomonas sp. Q11 TaxID=2968470 RepID=UPI002108FD89|nr:hypothetical protein [Pseudomonas sp. Q11]MCQ6255369.1 hypothetical protein [Pseudomonas sp. Q11]